MDDYQIVFGDKTRVMFVFAHPDDLEIYAGGTVARLVHDSKKVKLVKMTTGNKGSRQGDISEQTLSEVRQNEDLKALRELGLTDEDSVNLNVGDGEIENSKEVIGKIVRIIREFKPEVVVTHNPELKIIRDNDGYYYINHRDHKNTALCVVDAVYPYSRDKLFYPEHLAEGLEPHIVSEFLFVDSWGHSETISIKVTAFIETRRKAIACHKSQFDEERIDSLHNYFALEKDGERFEQFWYVKAD